MWYVKSFIRSFFTLQPETRARLASPRRLLGDIYCGLQDFIAGMGNPWSVVKDALAVLRPTWFAALVTVIVTVALQNGQAVDSVASIIQTGRRSWQMPWLFASALVLAIGAYYFPRALLYVKYDRITPANSEKRFEPLRRWAPRVLGVLPLLSLAVTFFSAERGLKGAVYGLLCLLMAAIFLRILVVRRFLLYPAGSSPAVKLHSEMPNTTLFLSLSTLVIAALFLVAFLNIRVWLPQQIGPLSILFLAAAMWISFGSIVLIYPTYRYTLPSLFLVLILLAACFGGYNDNHAVRILDGDFNPAVRPTVAKHLDGWLEARKEGWNERAGGNGGAYPLFVVAAEGGGIRAGYWTAAVLASLEEAYPGFACHVFAVSGVSGGSLGGAAFAAAIADLVKERSYVCDGRLHDQPMAQDAKVLARVTEALGEDFLAPTLAGLFFPDITQRFLPLPIFPDRATYLEEAWEAAWRARPEESGFPASDRFAEEFLALWAPSATPPPAPTGDPASVPAAPPSPPATRYQVPSLFLNGTWVQSGGRTLTSNLRLEEPSPDESEPVQVEDVPPLDKSEFVQVEDMLAFLGRPIRLSTAVHMSARFTYVSPAGTVHGWGKGSNPDRHVPVKYVVDGGYFENSGSLTAAEIIRTIREHCNKDENECAIKPLPIAIIISNSENNPNAQVSKNGTADDETQPPLLPEEKNPSAEVSNGGAVDDDSRPPLLPETASPVLALLNTRSARGYQAEASLTLMVGDGRSVRFDLKEPEDEATVPLGWTLSAGTREAMNEKAVRESSSAKKQFIDEWHIAEQMTADTAKSAL